MAFDVLQSKSRKLQQLHELLNDPEIAPEVRQLFAQRNGTAAPPSATAQPQRRGGRRKSKKLVRVALEVVQRSEGPVSARHVADQMEQEGFRFSAGNKYIAVSKALRRMADEKEIHAETGPTPKAPIMYSRIA